MNEKTPLKVLCIVGARPNFMKIAPLMRAFNADPKRFEPILLHTGQHYDEAMKASFFKQLDIPEPDIDLGVGSGTHAEQTAQIMLGFEPVLNKLKPDVLLVVGDVNSTIACALVAVKNHVPVVHVEAGLRSGDREMPEEINRILTDQISDLLYTTEADAENNLQREGIDKNNVVFVGNVMIDTLIANKQKAVPATETLSSINGFEGNIDNYGVLTMHRPSNVDNVNNLRSLIETLVEVSQDIPLVFPVHPRTQARIKEAGLNELLKTGRIAQIPPLGYLQLLGLMANARIVLSDSGGIQEETTALGVPCVTLRENTERPITVTQGTNTIVGVDASLIKSSVADVVETGGKAGRVPELWDGKAAIRIADHLFKHFR